MLKILLVDDHEMLRSGLKVFLKSILPHAATDEAANGEEAFKKIKQEKYQLVMLDINMPGTDSWGLLQNILVVDPGANVLVFSMNPEELYARRYLQGGARGYIGKNAPNEEMAAAIQAVLSGKNYMSPALKMLFATEIIDRKKQSSNPFDRLSTREFAIMQHLVEGDSPAEICARFNLHSSTVATYKSRIFEKLDCKKINDLVLLAKLYQESL